MCIIKGGFGQGAYGREAQALAAVPRPKDRWDHGLVPGRERHARAPDGPHRPGPWVIQDNQMQYPQLVTQHQRGACIIFSPSLLLSYMFQKHVGKHIQASEECGAARRDNLGSENGLRHRPDRLLREL